MTQNSDSQKDTLDYYQSNAKKFFDGTVSVDVTDLYTPFLELMPDTGSILDAGCGSGRDTRFFMRQGFKVTAFDNSSEMVKLASDFTGQDCLLLSFDDISFENKYDGVWACSSLLHVPIEELHDAISRLTRSLKMDGILYTSFKYGKGEHYRSDRHFVDFDEDGFDALIKEHPELSVIKYWKTSDVRPGREDEKWLNILLKKIC